MESPRSPEWALASLALTGTLLITGCGTPTPKTVRVSGDVVMVTRDGESVTLGLVEVRAIPETEFLAFVKTKNETAEEQIKKLGPELDRARWLVDYSKAEIALIEPEHNLAFAQTKVNPESKEASRRYREIHARALVAAERMDARREELRKLEEEAQSWESAAYYFQGMPTGFAATKTDPNGKFSLTLPEDQNVVLVAQAERHDPDGTERAYWCVRFRASQTGPTRITLSSDNQVTSDSPTSLLHLSR